LLAGLVGWIACSALAAPAAAPAETPADVPEPGLRQVLRLSDVMSPDTPEVVERDSSAWGKALGQYIGRATNGHASILEARSAVTGALAGADAAGWQRAPTATFSREYAGKYAKQTYSNLLRVQQPLWTGGLISAGIDLAQHQANRARHALREAQRNQALKITASWSEWARASLRATRLEKLVEQQASLLEMISRRYAQGSATVSDEALARARLEGALGEQAQARIDLAYSRAQLERNTAGTVEDSLLTDLDGPMPAIPTMAEAIDAIESAPALNRAATDIDIARSELAQRRAGLHPQVFLRLDRQWGAIKDEKVSVALQGSTGAGLSGLAALDVQEARVQSARLAVETLRSELRDQYTQEHTRYASADQRARLTQAYAQTSGSVLASYRRQFDAGRRSWLELLNMVREVHQAELDAAAALIDQRLAAFRVLLLVRSPDLNNDFTFGQDLPR
jgi:outer membrane protein, adhesin transport system